MNDAEQIMITRKAPGRIDLYHLYQALQPYQPGLPHRAGCLEGVGGIDGMAGPRIRLQGILRLIFPAMQMSWASAYTRKQRTQPTGSLKSCAQRGKSSFSAAPISGAPRHSRRLYLTAMFLSAVSASTSGKRFSAPSARERSAPTASGPFWSSTERENSGTRRSRF